MKTRHLMFTAALMGGLLSPLPLLGQFISAVGGAESDTATISVSGIGEVLVAPERAVLFIQVASEDGTAGAAAMANGALRSSVTERLASLGFGPEGVSLWGYGAGPAANRGRVPPAGPDGGGTTFEAKSGIRVVVEPLSRLDEVASAVLQAGASSIPIVEMEGGESEEARREATRIAVEQARVTAEAMAEAVGGRLGDLINVTVLPDYNAVVSTNRFFQGGLPGQGVQLFPSDVAVRVQVQASWVFERR